MRFHPLAAAGTLFAAAPVIAVPFEFTAWFANGPIDRIGGSCTLDGDTLIDTLSGLASTLLSVGSSR